jgi:hypothetical protein
MSSGCRQARRRGSSSGFIVAHPAKDLVADPTAESADRLGLGVAHRPAMLEVRLARPLALELGDRNPMEPNVELAVASPTQTMSFGVARPDRERS